MKQTLEIGTLARRSASARRHACVPKLYTTNNPCVQTLRRAGTSSHQNGTSCNDYFSVLLAIESNSAHYGDDKEENIV